MNAVIVYYPKAPLCLVVLEDLSFLLLLEYRLNRLSYNCMPFKLFPYITPMDHGQVCCCRQSSFSIHRNKITAQMMAKLCGAIYKTD